MQDISNNLAFLSRRITALEKKVQSLEANLADNIITTERLADVVNKVVDDLDYNTSLGHTMTKHFTELHRSNKEQLDKLVALIPALTEHIENELPLRIGRKG